MKSVWTATSPKSKAPRSLPGKDNTTLMAVLAELRSALPSFHDHVGQDHQNNASHPGSLDINIKDTSEKAYQRAFFAGRTTRITGSSCGEINARWLDIEVPVVSGSSPRRPCLDMIGMVARSPSIIVELKDTNGTSPFHAIHEILSYGRCARDNHRELVSHKKWTGPTGDISIPRYWPDYRGKFLVVGGPDDYWAKWKSCFDLIAAAGVTWLKQSELVGHHLIFVTFPSDDFKQQKGADLRYTPRSKSGAWNVLFEAHYPCLPPRHS